MYVRKCARVEHCNSTREVESEMMGNRACKGGLWMCMKCVTDSPGI